MANKKFVVGILIVIVLIGAALLLDYLASKTKNPHNITPTELSGEVSYLERIALPAGSTVQVALQDTSRADAPATTLAETTIITEGENVPIPFSLTYDAGSINPSYTYTLSARILVNDTLRWINTESIPVLTNGAPTNNVSVLVRGASINTPNEEEKGVQILDQNFELESFNGEKVSAGSKYTLSFNETNIQAKFCNGMGGAYTLEGDVIKAPQMISTLMVCQTPANLMTIESTFGKILSEGAKISQDGNSLSISKDTNTFVFKKV